MTAPRPFRPSSTQRAVLALCWRPTRLQAIREAIRPPGCVVLNGSGLSRSMKALEVHGLLCQHGQDTFQTTVAGHRVLEALNARSGRSPSRPASHPLDAAGRDGDTGTRPLPPGLTITDLRPGGAS